MPCCWGMSNTGTVTVNHFSGFPPCSLPGRLTRASVFRFLEPSEDIYRTCGFHLPREGVELLNKGLTTIKDSTFIAKGLEVLMTYGIATNKTFTHGKSTREI